MFSIQLPKPDGPDFLYYRVVTYQTSGGGIWFLTILESSSPLHITLSNHSHSLEEAHCIGFDLMQQHAFALERREHRVIKATLMRERMPDVYDPVMKFRWIVEVEPPIHIPTARQWVEQNLNAQEDETMLWGRLIGFVHHDDAMLFYLAHA